jgi:predicted small lipoprotein YifL
MRSVTAILVLALLAACGRMGPPRPPGPLDQITFPRQYPAPDRIPAMAVPSTASPAAAAPAEAPPMLTAPAR